MLRFLSEGEEYTMRRHTLLRSIVTLVMAVMLSLPAAPVLAKTKTYTATVKKTPMIRINLRAKPSASSRRLGAFLGGTKVKVLSVTGKWARVEIKGIKGYMYVDYLVGKLPKNTKPAPAKTTTDTDDQPVTWPSPGRAISKRLTLYVSTGNSGKLHLRQHATTEAPSLGLYPNGTQVSAIKLSSGWSRVTVNGRTGYMLTRYLSAQMPEPEPEPLPIGWAVVRHRNNSFVYLRSSRSTDDLSNVLAKVPSGAIVDVYETDRWYSLISYNGIMGYMVTLYLDFQ